MARRALALSPPAWPGAVAAGGLAALCLGTLAVLARAGQGGAGQGGGGLGPADIAAIRFTLSQAALSALLSVALAVPVARALARRRFAGRAAFVTALGAPFLLPVIVAVLGLVAIFGQRGAVNAALGALGLPAVDVYGLGGVVLAHVFLNLPLAVRMILHGWQAIPAERLRLAASLGFSAREVARHIERPMLRAVLPGALLAIFLVCLGSFAVALILGGGPRATTVELAIYQAVRFDFDLGRAALLALVQAGLCAAAVVAAGAMAAPSGFGPGAGRRIEAVPGAAGPVARAADALVLLAAAALISAPIAAVVARGLPEIATLPAPVWQAALRSALIAPVSAAVAVAGAVALLGPILRGGAGGRAAEVAAMLPVVASPLVLGAGLFLLLFPVIAPDRVALGVTAVLNGVLALPFVLRLLIPPAREIAAAEGRLAAALGLSAAGFLRLVLLPRLRRPLGFGAGVAVAFAMGDLGVIALFATEAPTLPLQVMRLMGAFRMDEAAGAALLLVVMAFAGFALCDRWGRGGDAQA